MHRPVSLIALLLCPAACGSYRGPPCEDLLFSPLSIDLTEPVPSFSWDGDNPNGFAVIDDLGAPVWELHCACKADLDDPGGETHCRDRIDWTFSACLEPPLRYGEIPPIETLSAAPDLVTDAVPLVPGKTYTAAAWSLCSAPGVRQIASSEDFTVIPTDAP